ncbi:MAG: hypothetical protein SOW59_00135 [Corynebacterium sp.]|nr:hypothetical protein [Corynebacterium sp.]
MRSQCAPNLYQALALDPQAQCHAIGSELVGRVVGDTPCYEVQMGFAVLASPTKRTLYDAALSAGRILTWEDVEYLANFGTWPPEIAPDTFPYGWGEPVVRKTSSYLTDSS